MRQSLARPRLWKLATAPARTGLRILYARRRLLGANVEGTILKLINPKRHRFVPPDISVGQFFKKLDDRQARYVVLRWFEGLPRLDRQHDLDLLVADASLEVVKDELTLWPVGHPVDLYSVTGADDAGYRVRGDAQGSASMSISVFPASMAQRVLERRVRFKDICFVPNPNDHFCTLAYHATYLKAVGLGLAVGTSPGEAMTSASHDYAATLVMLGANVGINLSGAITRDSLDDLLAELGWRPEPSQLRLLAGSAPWLRDKHFSHRPSSAV